MEKTHIMVYLFTYSHGVSVPCDIWWARGINPLLYSLCYRHGAVFDEVNLGDRSGHALGRHYHVLGVPCVVVIAQRHGHERVIAKLENVDTVLDDVRRALGEGNAL